MSAVVSDEQDAHNAARVVPGRAEHKQGVCRRAAGHNWPAVNERLCRADARRLALDAAVATLEGHEILATDAVVNNALDESARVVNRRWVSGRAGRQHHPHGTGPAELLDQGHEVGTGVRALGAERMPVFGDSIVFGEDSIVVTDEEKLALRRLGEQIQGKLQKIEIRGHTTRRPLPAGSPYADHWELAYARAREVMRLLVEQGIDPRRLRISVSGGNEPAYQGDDARAIRANSRVDLFLLNEFSGDDEKSSAPPSAAQSVR